MIEALLLGYVTIGMATALFIFVVGRRLRDRRHPASHPAAASAVAGVAWPMVLLGAIEIGSIALLAKVVRQKQRLAVHA